MTNYVTWFQVNCQQCGTAQPCNQYGRVKYHKPCGYTIYDFNARPKRVIQRRNYTEEERW